MANTVNTHDHGRQGEEIDGGELTRSTFSFLRSSSDADEAAAMVARGGSDTAVCLGRLGFATTMQERASERGSCDSLRRAAQVDWFRAKEWLWGETTARNKGVATAPSEEVPRYYGSGILVLGGLIWSSVLTHAAMPNCKAFISMGDKINIFSNPYFLISID
jgi:hypothetical protein